MAIEITTIEQGSEQIERNDRDLAKLLERDEYTTVIEHMKLRLLAISQITKLKGDKKLNTDQENRLNNIFNSANSLQEKVLAKKNKINERLKSRRKLVAQNKSMGYDKK